MNKQNVIASSAAALVALVAIGGVAMSSFAAEDTTSTDNEYTRPSFARHIPDELKEEWQAKRDEWRAARQAEMQAVRDAIEAEDYDAWKEAVHEDAPILEKINEENFPRLVEMHNLREQANDIREELGIERGDMRGDSAGYGRGMGKRQGHGMGWNK